MESRLEGERRLIASSGERLSLPRDPTVEQLREVFRPDVIQEVVHEFYQSVRADSLLGPVFETRIGDWPTHLRRMTLFWGTILRAEPGFHPSPRGNPAQLHRLIHELEPSHFDRWLTLFGEVCRGSLHPSAAEHMVTRASRIALVLSAHLTPATPVASSPREVDG